MLTSLSLGDCTKRTISYDTSHVLIVLFSCIQNMSKFQACKKLKQVETSDIFLLDALLTQMPRVEIAKKFCNRNGGFPIPRSNQLTLTAYAKITSLSLVSGIITGPFYVLKRVL